MKIFIDPEIYEVQEVGGISRIFNETLPLICDLEPNANLTFVHDDIRVQEPPTHKQIDQIFLLPLKKYLRPKRMWAPMYPFIQRVARKMQIAHTKKDIWLSTYYRSPPLFWRGHHVVCVYDLIYEKYLELFDTKTDKKIRKLKRKSIQNADNVICISETTRQDLLDLYEIDSEKTRVIPLGVSQPFNEPPGDCFDINGINTGPYFIYVGKRSHHKNFSIVLNAFARWNKKDSVGLLIIGAKCSPEEKKQIRKLGISESIRFLDEVNDNELACYYSNAIGLIYPSLYEGFGIPLLEAMSLGCPVLASRIPSTLEVAGEVPIYFDPFQVEELIEALDTAYSGAGVEKKVRGGLAKLKQFSWQNSARKFLDILFELDGTR